MHFKSFIEQFFLPELRSFLNKWPVILGVIGVMTLALWSIGFSQGSSDFLASKMDSPFIRFLNINLPLSIPDHPNYRAELKKGIRDTARMNNFSVETAQFVPTGVVSLLNIENENTVRTRIRMISPDSNRRLYNFLFRNPSNKDLLLTTEKLVRLDQEPWSIVVSQELLNDLGYPEDNPPLYLNLISDRDRNDKAITHPLLIAGIVKQLPDKMGALLSPTAFYAATNRMEYYPFNTNLREYRITFSAFIQSEEPLSTVRTEIEKVIDPNEVRYQLSENKSHYRRGFDLRIDYLESENPKGLYNQLEELPFFQETDNTLVLARAYERVSLGSLKDARNDYLVLEFNELDSVPKAADYLQSNFDLTANLNDIESAKNFSVFNKLSTVLSALLTIFTIIILIYIVSKTIIEHINQNKASLGTLKAFGLSNFIITLVYSGVALIIVLIVFISGFVLAALIGYFLTDNLMHQFLGLALDGKHLFRLEFNLLYVGAFLILPLLIILRLVYKRLDGTTPGDLIYGR